MKKQKQSKLVHYLSCQAIICIAHDHFSYGHVLKGLGLRTYLALLSKVQAFALSTAPVDKTRRKVYHLRKGNGSRKVINVLYFNISVCSM